VLLMCGALDLRRCRTWVSQRMDRETKRGDYEKAGVREYWIINPDDLTISALVLRDGQFRANKTGDAGPCSVVLPGFGLDIERLKSLFARD